MLKRPGDQCVSGRAINIARCLMAHGSPLGPFIRLAYRPKVLATSATFEATGPRDLVIATGGLHVPEDVIGQR